MNLSVTPKSIVPEQSVIDSWPKLHRKKGGHACQGKCPEFKDEQCGHCLVNDDQVLQNSDEAKFYAKYLEAVSYAP